MAKRRRFIIDIDEETNKKKLVLGDVVLLIIFGGLIALIISLILTVAKNEKEPQNVFADLIVPVIEEKSYNEFSINLAEIKDNKYIIKVTNYRKENIINIKEVSYNLEVINKENVEIELYKNEIKDNLISKNNSVLIEKNMLKASKKQEDVYKIVVVDDKKLTSKDTLKIIISS